MQCQEIMKEDIETVRLDDTVAEAARRMRSRGVGFLPVCDEARIPRGVITDRDIVIRAVAEGLEPASIAVADVMTLEIVSCRRQDDIEVAAAFMAQNHKSRIMVVGDDGTLVGVLSLSDIAQIEEPALVGETLRDVSEREVQSGAAQESATPGGR